MFIRNIPETQELHEIVVNTLAEGIYMVDRDMNILVWNEAAERITGYTQYEMLGQHCPANLLDHIDSTGAPLCNHDCPMWTTMKDGRQRTKELFLRHKSGYRVSVQLKSSPVEVDGETIGSVASFTENRIQFQEEYLVDSLAKLVTTDQLTGLANKHQTELILDNMLDEYRRIGNNLSVMYINLDDFSSCNREFGYETGNELLVALADTFRESFRDNDFIGRWDGEEFVGVFETTSSDHLRMLSEKIRSLIESVKIEFLGSEVKITASIGATMVNAGDTAKHLIDRAASLMHVSKISGKNCVTIG